MSPKTIARTPQPAQLEARKPKSARTNRHAHMCTRKKSEVIPQGTTSLRFTQQHLGRKPGKGTPRRRGRPGSGRRAPAASDGIPIADVGSLRVLDNDTTATEPLPVRARRKRAGLVLESPPVPVLDRGADRLPLYAIGPESLGGLRLRSILIDPEIEGEGRWNEVWSILPGPESRQDHWSFYLTPRALPRLQI